MHGVDTGIESESAYQQQQRRKAYFWRVVNCYVDFRFVAHPLVASSMDPDVRPKKLGPDTIHFLVDVELATRKALKSRPLYAEWQKLIQGEADTPNSTAIINKSARIYMARRLMPRTYFTHIKKGRADRRLLPPKDEAKEQIPAGVASDGACADKAAEIATELTGRADSMPAEQEGPAA